MTMACKLLDKCERTLRVDYVEENAVSRNWCDKAATTAKEHIHGCDVVLSKEIYELLESGKVKSIVISLNDCFYLRQKEED